MPIPEDRKKVVAEPEVEPVKKAPRKPVPLPEHSKGKYYEELFRGGN